MREIAGNIWDYHGIGSFLVVTTNCDVNRHGNAIMGRGIAAQTAQRYPGLPRRLGELIKQRPQAVRMFEAEQLIMFPVKFHWNQPASLTLIQQSAEMLMQMDVPGQIYSVRPGCGNGGLRWEDVRPILEPIFGDKIIIVERGTVW